MAIASTLPFISLGCCLWIPAGGVLAVYLYRRRRPAGALSTGAGARLGALAGLIGFCIYALLLAIVMAVERFLLHAGPQLRDVLRQALESAARNPDPRTQEMLHRLNTPEGLAFLLTFMLVAFFFAFLIFAAVGGAIGAAFTGQKPGVRSN